MSLKLPPLPSIRDVVKLYRLSASKQLSQNFLFNEVLTNKIVKQAGKIRDGHVVEVGPGPGSLTRNILRKMPRKLTVIERDRRFGPILDLLAESFSMINGKMDILFNDILLTNMEGFLDKSLMKSWDHECPNIHIIGNLPFNVSTPLIIKWLQAISEKKNAWALGRVKMTLTFQKEVAERLTAEPRTETRCRLSVMAQTWTETELKFIIPGKRFVPAPKVDVGVVTFTPLIKPRTSHEFKFYEKFVRHMFSFRQKYSIRCAETLIPPEYHTALAPLMYQLADLDPKTRPMQFTVEEIDRLCTAYKYICEKHPEITLYEYRASRRILPNTLTKDVLIEDYDGEDECLSRN